MAATLFVLCALLLGAACAQETRLALGTLGESYLSFLSVFGGRSENSILGNERLKKYDEDGNCASSVVKLGTFNEMKISARSKGLCANCCSPKQSRDVHFVLYNRNTLRNGGLGAQIAPQMRSGSATKAGMIPRSPTVVFIHGFTETSPGFSGKEIVDAYMSRPEPYNVVLLDWSELCTFPWYVESYRNVKLVASALKNFLEFYHESGEIPISSVHVVGFSLGAHVAGFAGKSLKKGLKIPRITALDPAFPEFPLTDTSQRLCSTDADFIDVIHTDAGILGFPISLGHADFYPNGGRALQPGCQLSYLAQISLFDMMFACSHVRAWRLYAESVRNPAAFPATKCRLWRGKNRKCEFSADAYMGFAASKSNARGSYYLMTKHTAPFSKSVAEQTKKS